MKTSFLSFICVVTNSFVWSTLHDGEHQTIISIPLLLHDAFGNTTTIIIQVPCGETMDSSVLSFCNERSLDSANCDALRTTVVSESQEQCFGSLEEAAVTKREKHQHRHQGNLLEFNVEADGTPSKSLDRDIDSLSTRNARNRGRRKRKQPHRSRRCVTRDQTGYCMYYHSLCIDRGGGLILLTDNRAHEGKYVNFSNLISRSPLHIPVLTRVPGTQFDHWRFGLDSSEAEAETAPYRSFFPGATMKVSPPEGATWIPDWSLVAAFDYATKNIFHFITKIHVGFLARYYELEEGLGESYTHSHSNISGDELIEDSDSAAGILDSDADRDTASSSSRNRMRNGMQNDVYEDALKNLIYNRSSGYKHAYLFHRQITPWQRNYAELALGLETNLINEESILQQAPLCFERAVIPGASVGVGDGITTSMVFREMAAELKGIRVSVQERNVITIFQHPSHSIVRSITNIEEVFKAVKDLADEFKMEVSLESWTDDTPFEYQAMLMARTRVMISMHGATQSNCVFMEAGGVVLEINPYQFIYPLYQWVAMNRGHYYLRHEVPLNDTIYYRQYGQNNGDFGKDPYPGVTARDCAKNNRRCYIVRRDGSVRVDLSWFRPLVMQAISLVV